MNLTGELAESLLLREKNKRGKKKLHVNLVFTVVTVVRHYSVLLYCILAVSAAGQTD